ncbi:hypothetical protein HID58_011370 [Brassica napus]|uniref:Thioredoxin domain-containing protein n=1 Tax=Brassica napus TaxID=3708 RepID=A0ABQ8E026_BRANA|nr:hypothetical protein HID58_011370 [Brassica napus]
MASLHDCITEILLLSLLITSSISSTSAVTVGSHVRFPECKGEIVCEDQGTTSAAAVEGKFKFYKINTDESPNTTNRYGIRSVPTVIIFKDGEKKDSITGAASVLFDSVYCIGHDVMPRGVYYVP